MQPVGRVEDAAAPTGYLGVAQSADLVDELALAAVGIDEVGVRVAERREYGTVLCVYNYICLF